MSHGRIAPLMPAFHFRQFEGKYRQSFQLASPPFESKHPQTTNDLTPKIDGICPSNKPYAILNQTIQIAP
jgi:hypothetical protein